MPAELRPNWKRKPTTAAGPNGSNKRAKLFGRRRLAGDDNLSVEEKLKALEEKENGTAAGGGVKGAASAAGEDGKDKNKAAGGDSDDDTEEEQTKDELDDEMDDENDYGNSYFDNGDAYNEEDDNLDDGPVY